MSSATVQLRHTPIRSYAARRTYSSSGNSGGAVLRLP
jgi:hypothetical protein